MKKTFLFCSLIMSLAATAQNQEVQNTISTFFEGFHAKDSVKMKTVCANKMIMQTIADRPKGAKLLATESKDFFKSIATIPADVTFQEKILSYNIQTDGAMAHAWTPYEFYLNGKLSHKGVNAFTLFKEHDLWKIIYIIDTRRN